MEQCAGLCRLSGPPSKRKKRSESGEDRTAVYVSCGSALCGDLRTTSPGSCAARGLASTSRCICQSPWVDLLLWTRHLLSGWAALIEAYGRAPLLAYPSCLMCLFDMPFRATALAGIVSSHLLSTVYKYSDTGSSVYKTKWQRPIGSETLYPPKA